MGGRAARTDNCDVPVLLREDTTRRVRGSCPRVRAACVRMREMRGAVYLLYGVRWADAPCRATLLCLRYGTRSPRVIGTSRVSPDYGDSPRRAACAQAVASFLHVVIVSGGVLDMA